MNADEVVWLIRPLEKSEGDAFIKLYAEIFPEKNPTADDWVRMQEEPATVIVAQHNDGRLSAFLYFWTVANEIQVIDVGVQQEFRRQGLARALFDFIFSDGAYFHKKIFLEVKSKNTAAIFLYRSLGFVKDGERKEYYADDDDAWMYSKKI